MRYGYFSKIEIFINRKAKANSNGKIFRVSNHNQRSSKMGIFMRVFLKFIFEINAFKFNNLMTSAFLQIRPHLCQPKDVCILLCWRY